MRKPVDRPARALAYGAWDVLDGARHAALAAPRRSAVRRSSRPPRAGAGGATLDSLRAVARSAPSGRGRVAIVFGPEATGLRRDELDLCPWRIHIPTAAEHSSLNLAQAVMVVAYEIHLSGGSAAGRPPQPAPRAAFEGAVGGARRGAARGRAT